MKIVSLALNLPGPVAVARLVAAGAAAIKIEPPWGDPLAGICRPWYDDLHANVTIERLDLKTAAGLDAVKVHLASADVFIAGHRPRALVGLGLDADALATPFPTLRHLNIVGNTAHPDQAGHDLNYQAKAGLVQATLPLTLAADMAGAERAHGAVLALMHEGPGSRRVVGLFDAVSDLAAPLRYGLTAPGGPLGGANPAYGIYPTKTGLVAIGALEPHFRARLYDTLELPDGSDLSITMLTRTAAEWEGWAAERDIPLVEVRQPLHRPIS